MTRQAAEAAQGEVVIRCTDIWKSFGAFTALRGVSTEIRAGEVVCIVGPSGGGKSTFLRTLNGLEKIERGTIDVLGTRLPGSKREIESIRRRVGMVFQSFNLFPQMTVRQNLTLAPMTALRVSRDEANARAERLLARVGIANQIEKYPSQLSGGQQQRVAIARALAMQPAIMLFDEPTSALDPEMVKEVLDVMRDLAAGGMTMLVVTHEMGFAREVADRLLFIAEGQILSDAAPDEFFGNPKDERHIAFMSKIL
jgi:ABC-type polar amino acid transport system ATPase subunit